MLLALFADVRLAALDDGVLEVAVDDGHTHALRHQIIGEGYAERRPADAAFLVGKCHYDRCLYHVRAIIDYGSKLPSEAPEKRNVQHLCALSQPNLNI